MMRFNKKDTYVDWKIEVKSASSEDAPLAEMNEIYSYAQSKDDKSWIYACGYKWVDPSQELYRNAATMKFSTQGDVQFIDVWAPDTVDQRDTCRSVAFDEDSKEIIYLLEVSSELLRPSYSTNYKYSSENTEAMIVVMQPGGSFLKSYNINYGTSGISLHIGGHSSFVHDGSYFFGSYSWGYKTQLQNQTFDTVTPTYDTHLFKVNPDSDVNCFYMDETSSSSMSSLYTRYSFRDIADKTQPGLLFTKETNIFLGYSSKYSGGFDLMDTLKYPKMWMDFS